MDEESREGLYLGALLKKSSDGRLVEGTEGSFPSTSQGARGERT